MNNNNDNNNSNVADMKGIERKSQVFIMKCNAHGVTCDIY